MPLSGKRILTTRSKAQAKELAKLIASHGGEAIELPVIQLRAPTSADVLAKLDVALRALPSYDWLVFTSVNGVEFFFQRLRFLHMDVHMLRHARIAAVGPKTLAALEQRGLCGEVLPEEYVAESLLDSLLPKLKQDDKVLLPRSNIARSVLPQALRDHGLQVDDVVVYENHLVDDHQLAIVQELSEQRLDFITFTSSSTVRNFMQILSRHTDQPFELIGEQVAIACIGRITAETASQLGLHVHCLAKEATMTSLIQSMIDYVKKA